MLILGREQMRRAIGMEQAIPAVEDAFAQLSAGKADVPLRAHLAVPAEDAVALIMPSHLTGSNALGVKLLTLYPHNPARRELPAINAIFVLFDTSDGLPLALMDAGYLTALRTGAASGVAAKHMARDDARVLALFGAGAQALFQVWAVCLQRPIERVLVVNRTREHAERLVGELRAFGAPVPQEVVIADTLAQTLAAADVVCCATGATDALFDDGMVRDGMHINAIGAYRPDMREVPGETVARARVVVDERRGAWAEAGDLILARDEGLIAEGHVVGELGEVVLGQMPGRTALEEVTLFKSVGNAVQDVAVAQVAYRRAREAGLGTEVAL
jgi:ornithine cyclodeaminase